MITLTRHHHLGEQLRALRELAGLTTRQLGAAAHISKSAVSKREHSSGITANALVEHVGPLGYDVALIRRVHPGARPTGTGWPA